MRPVNLRENPNARRGSGRLQSHNLGSDGKRASCGSARAPRGRRLQYGAFGITTVPSEDRSNARFHAARRCSSLTLARSSRNVVSFANDSARAGPEGGHCWEPSGSWCRYWHSVIAASAFAASTRARSAASSSASVGSAGATDAELDAGGFALGALEALGTTLTAAGLAEWDVDAPVGGVRSMLDSAHPRRTAIPNAQRVAGVTTAWFYHRERAIGGGASSAAARGVRVRRTSRDMARPRRAVV